MKKYVDNNTNEIFFEDEKTGKIYDENMNELEVARHPEQILKLKFPKELPPYSMLFRKAINEYVLNNT